MLFLYVVLLVGAFTLLICGVVEQRRHNANLAVIGHRVLVNGIRGKSSITRLCAGALRSGGLITVAKTTGTAARFIRPDATEEPVYRRFDIANIIEQTAIVRRAARYRPDALVMECMAVNPTLQEINQTKLVRATIGVLSNVRPDHLEEMGPTLDDVARSLSRAMPEGGVCVTAEQERMPVLRQEAASRNCRLVVVDPDSVTDAELRDFGTTTFKENVAIALRVAELLGVGRDDALRGMRSAPPDPGVSSVESYLVGGKLVRFGNLLAANDPESTWDNILRLRESGAITGPIQLLINCRPDRIARNRQMGALTARIDPDRVILIGDPTRTALKAVGSAWRDRVVDLGRKRDADDVLSAIVSGIDTDTSVVAIGSVHGQAERLIERLREFPAAGLTPDAPAQRSARSELGAVR